MRLLSTFNFKLSTKCRAFTLMEILVAASIFAGVMIMATAVLGQSSAFRGKIRATRETSEEAKKLADMITRDVQSANGNAKYTVGTTTYNFKNGLAFLKYAVSSGWSPKYNATPEVVVDNFDAYVLIIATKDDYIVYGAAPNRVCRQTFSAYLATETRDDFKKYDAFVSNVGVCGSGGNLDYYNANKDKIVIAGNTNTDGTKPEVTLKFGGYLPDGTSSNKQQSYVMFDIVSRTKNYASLQPNSRAQMEIRSAVTARNFAN